MLAAGTKGCLGFASVTCELRNLSRRKEHFIHVLQITERGKLNLHKCGTSTRTSFGLSLLNIMSIHPLHRGALRVGRESLSLPFLTRFKPVRNLQIPYGNPYRRCLRTATAAVLADSAAKCPDQRVQIGFRS